MSPELAGLLAFVAVSAAYAYFGWRCFTGRTVFWLRYPTFVDAWWPMGLYTGVAMFFLSVGVLAVYLIEEVVAADAATRPMLGWIAGIGLAVGILAMVLLVLALGSLLWIEQTFRRKPEGTRLARLLLPKWYRDELRRRIGVDEAVPGDGEPGGSASVPPSVGSGPSWMPSAGSPPPPPPSGRSSPSSRSSAPGEPLPPAAPADRVPPTPPPPLPPPPPPPEHPPGTTPGEGTDERRGGVG